MAEDLEIAREMQDIAPKSALPADEIWLFNDASRPGLLREEGKDEYAFLGEVVVLNTGDTMNNGGTAIRVVALLAESAGWKNIWLI